MRVGNPTDSRAIYNITWTDNTGSKEPEDCFFVTWCKDEDGNNDFPVVVGQNERVTTTKTFVFPEGLIKPGEPQVYYMYLWNRWVNKDWEGNELEAHEGWWNPNGIYPDRFIMTLDTSDGLVFEVMDEDGEPRTDVDDSVSLSGGSSAGEMLTAKITDKDGQDASEYWTNFQWFSDGQLVAKDSLTYIIQPSDAGKEIVFTCEAKEDSDRLGLLRAAKTLPDLPVYELPQTGDQTPLTLYAAVLLVSVLGMAVLSKRSKRV